jgi:hypothetical protein
LRKLFHDGDKLMINWQEETMEEDGKNLVAFRTLNQAMECI